VNKAAKRELLLDLHPETLRFCLLTLLAFQLANTLRSLRVAQLLNEYLER